MSEIEAAKKRVNVAIRRKVYNRISALAMRRGMTLQNLTEALLLTGIRTERINERILSQP